MSANAKNGSAIESQANQEPTRHAPVHRAVQILHEDQGPLLAQIPDLDSKAVPVPPRKRIDGRIISQALSFKLVFGVGIGLVVGAILPFVFGKVNRREVPVKELPAWSNNGGATTNTSQTTAPTWPTPGPVSPATMLPPQTATAPTPAIVSPRAPQIGDTRPTAMIEPAWPQSRPSGTPTPGTTSTPPLMSYTNPPVTSAVPADNRGNYRGFDGAADTRSLEADTRSDPAAPVSQ